MRRTTLGLPVCVAFIPVSVFADDVREGNKTADPAHVVAPNDVVAMLRTQITRCCWILPPPVAAANTLGPAVRVGMKLNRDGSLSGEPVLLNSDTGLFQVVAESTLEAIRHSQPFKLPVAQYSVWKDVELALVPGTLR